MSDELCIFCQITAGSLPCEKIAEDDKSIAFLDIYPLARGHVLIVPKVHHVKLHELSSSTMQAVGEMILRVAKALRVKNYNLLQNNGFQAHQMVSHVHFHLIPQYGEGPSGEGLGGRLNQVWRPLRMEKKELTECAQEIRDHLEE